MHWWPIIFVIARLILILLPLIEKMVSNHYVRYQVISTSVFWTSYTYTDCILSWGLSIWIHLCRCELWRLWILVNLKFGYAYADMLLYCCVKSEVWWTETNCCCSLIYSGHACYCTAVLLNFDTLLSCIELCRLSKYWTMSNYLSIELCRSIACWIMIMNVLGIMIMNVLMFKTCM
jgi:hypothetical protein